MSSDEASFTIKFPDANFRISTALPDGHPCYALIGLIASEYARTENAVDQMIYALGDVVPTIGACITGQFIGLYPRYMALGQLAFVRAAPDAIAKEIKKQTDQSAAISEIRNRAIHDRWMADQASMEPQQFRTRAKKILNYGPVPVPIESLEEGLGKVRKHLDRAYALNRQINEFLEQRRA